MRGTRGKWEEEFRGGNGRGTRGEWEKDEGGMGEGRGGNGRGTRGEWERDIKSDEERIERGMSNIAGHVCGSLSLQISIS